MRPSTRPRAATRRPASTRDRTRSPRALRPQLRPLVTRRQCRCPSLLRTQRLPDHRNPPSRTLTRRRVLLTHAARLLRTARVTNPSVYGLALFAVAMLGFVERPWWPSLLTFTSNWYIVLTGHSMGPVSPYWCRGTVLPAVALVDVARAAAAAAECHRGDHCGQHLLSGGCVWSAGFGLLSVCKHDGGFRCAVVGGAAVLLREDGG